MVEQATHLFISEILAKYNSDTSEALECAQN